MRFFRPIWRRPCSIALLASLPYASFLSYSPRGTSAQSIDSRRICYRVKQDGLQQDGRPTIDAAVARLASDYSGAFADFLGPDVVLVPVPRSAPLPSKGGGPVLWVPRRICEALVAVGLGHAVVPCVERVKAVTKSATAAPGQRPTVAQHIESMRATLEMQKGPVTLVDDVVTKGATLIAAASVLTGAFPGIQVRAFSLLRTCGLVPEITQIIDPTVGTITRDRWGNVDRQP